MSLAAAPLSLWGLRAAFLNGCGGIELLSSVRVARFQTVCHNQLHFCPSSCTCNDEQLGHSRLVSGLCKRPDFSHRTVQVGGGDSLT